MVETEFEVIELQACDAKYGWQTTRKGNKRQRRIFLMVSERAQFH